MKINVSTSIEEADFKRLEQLAETDGSTIALMARKALKRGLPDLEKAVLRTEFVKPVKRKLAA